MKKLLIVEDELDLASTLQAELVSQGYDVRTCQTSEQALKHVMERKPDLILLDIMTSSIHGSVFVERIRQLPEGSNDPKVIVLTNLDNAISREKFSRLDISEYLVKSEVTIEQISEKVKSALG